MEDDMTTHEQSRQDCLDALQNAVIPTLLCDNKRAGDLTLDELQQLLQSKQQQQRANSSMVSLGDLGRKDIRHEPGDAGTTLSFQQAREFLNGFGLDYNIVTGNHDLEGLDEFDTDEANIQAFLDCFGFEAPYFMREIANRTLLVGLSTVRFRSAPYSSHEVHVDDEQIAWFQETVRQHSAEDGWKIVVVSHAPIAGSGLRVLQSVHVMNGCAWLNHCSDNRNVFIETVRQNPQIKLWFSGHFHLSHDYEDSISTVGSCSFVQTGVMGPVSSRDGRRQTRLVCGNETNWQVYSINHHVRDENDKAQVRLDAEIDLETGSVELVSHHNQETDREDWFQAYSTSFVYMQKKISSHFVLQHHKKKTGATLPIRMVVLPTLVLCSPRFVGGTCRMEKVRMSLDCMKILLV